MAIQDQSKNTNLGILSSIFTLQRSNTDDIIHFRNGDVLRGVVMNENFELSTIFGELSIEKTKIAGISLGEPNTNAASIATINFNLFNGIIDSSNIRFNSNLLGTEIKVRKDKIKYILFQKSVNKVDLPTPKDNTNLFVMTNGNLLTGKTVEFNINVQTNFDLLTLNFPEIQNIEMLNNGENITAIIKNKQGDITKGTFIDSELNLYLDIGLKLEKIHKNKISKIFIDDGNIQVIGYFSEAQTIWENPSSILDDPDNDEIITNSIGMQLKLIKPASFTMGSTRGENDEKPVHKVTITKPFHIGIYPVTQAEYNVIMGANPSKTPNANAPVEMVSWEEAKTFCEKLSEMENATYRLPTEAEWEYACKAGTTSVFYWGDAENGNFFWFVGNSGGRSQPVGQKKPNSWGLYDMSGNIWEWCEDWYSDMYPTSACKDPEGPPNGQLKSCVVAHGVLVLDTAAHQNELLINPRRETKALVFALY